MYNFKVNDVEMMSAKYVIYSFNIQARKKSFIKSKRYVWEHY